MRLEDLTVQDYSIAKMRNAYMTFCAEGCGICEKKGDLYGKGFKYWRNGFSQSAHSDCYKKIEPLEKRLKAFIRMHFENESNALVFNRNYHLCHERAISAVRKACGKDSILIFLQKNGESALAHLFNTVGVHAVKTSKL